MLYMENVNSSMGTVKVILTVISCCYSDIKGVVQITSLIEAFLSSRQSCRQSFAWLTSEVTSGKSPHTLNGLLFHSRDTENFAVAGTCF